MSLEPEIPQKPFVAIVILNYNCADMTIDCVRSIRRSSVAGLQVIVIDNASSDNSAKKLADALTRDNEKLIISPRNGGFAEGSNIGMIEGLKVGAKWIHLLNPDTEVDSNFYASLAEFEKASPDVSAVGPLGLFMDDRDKIWFAGGYFDWAKGRGECAHQGKSLKEFDVATMAGKSEFLTCACLLVKADVVRQIGILDSRYFLGGEEWDYSRRLAKAGIKPQFVPALRYWHHVSGSLEQKRSIKYIYNGYRTKLLFMRDQWPFLFIFWKALYKLYTSLRAVNNFTKLDTSLQKPDIKNAIRQAEKDDNKYSSIQLSHIERFS